MLKICYITERNPNIEAVLGIYLGHIKPRCNKYANISSIHPPVYMNALVHTHLIASYVNIVIFLKVLIIIVRDVV